MNSSKLQEYDSPFAIYMLDNLPESSQWFIRRKPHRIHDNMLRNGFLVPPGRVRKPRVGGTDLNGSNHWEVIIFRGE